MTHAEHFSGLQEIYETTYSGTKCFTCDRKSPTVKCKGSCSSSAMSISYDFNDIKKELNKLGWKKIKTVSEVGRNGIFGICPRCVSSIRRRLINPESGRRKGKNENDKLLRTEEERINEKCKPDKQPGVQA